jgi:hypothetical protein
MFPSEIPLEVGADVMTAMAAGLEAAGFEAFFKADTGFRTLWVRRSVRA